MTHLGVRTLRHELVAKFGTLYYLRPHYLRPQYEVRDGPLVQSKQSHAESLKFLMDLPLASESPRVGWSRSGLLEFLLFDHKLKAPLTAARDISIGPAQKGSVEFGTWYGT